MTNPLCRFGNDVYIPFVSEMQPTEGRMMKRISKAAAAAGLSLLASGCATFSQQKALTEK